MGVGDGKKAKVQINKNMGKRLFNLFFIQSIGFSKRVYHQITKEIDHHNFIKHHLRPQHPQRHTLYSLRSLLCPPEISLYLQLGLIWLLTFGLADAFNCEEVLTEFLHDLGGVWWVDFFIYYYISWRCLVRALRSVLMLEDE